ncbi:Flp family type IVb pilin [Croceicoccus naphthovorans]|uniref:Uncharacterized protein n=1 Tax=Croceicoccus naphthovorans TaxID=1348774 RepID=A0A0G3XFT0_9SPHN|nr:Flp family type IVb pilin [Croceicoccus naphthovorans]AKM10395.1 hypothetical protein AB433_11185 [Croceicoccus naphthovorans]MBB3990092.1 pilus assembly protein Flp/PilA [Croceicoccus naphthovorans]
MLNTILKFLDDENGATAVEYGLICAMLVIAMMTALNGVAGETIKMWTKITDSSRTAMQNSNPNG